jgi:riboflavin kinase/FMN adenylyltransferase
MDTTGSEQGQVDSRHRSIAISGVVERGDARGRTIGFPTANIAIGDDEWPTDGVYAGWFCWNDDRRWPAAINVGRRPTFYAGRGLRLVEAHLLDFTGDLYGERATLELRYWIREEQRFAGIEELVGQLAADAGTAGRLLGAESVHAATGLDQTVNS